jgi:hypothetical protein
MVEVVVEVIRVVEVVTEASIMDIQERAEAEAAVIYLEQIRSLL